MSIHEFDFQGVPFSSQYSGQQRPQWMLAHFAYQPKSVISTCQVSPESVSLNSDHPASDGNLEHEAASPSKGHSDISTG